MTTRKKPAKKKKAQFGDMYARLGQGEYIEFVAGENWADVNLIQTGPGFTFCAYRQFSPQQRQQQLKALATVKQYLTTLEDWIRAAIAE